MNDESSEMFVAVKTRKIDLEKRLDRLEDDVMAVEAPIQIFLNGKSLTTIMALPSYLKELGIGFLVDEGVLASHKAISRARAL